jgi:hypothetical protein
LIIGGKLRFFVAHPPKKGVHIVIVDNHFKTNWIPAFAGMTTFRRNDRVANAIFQQKTGTNKKNVDFLLFLVYHEWLASGCLQCS